ncbi:hypothetical protein D3C85_828270 [compost metagenome]
MTAQQLGEDLSAQTDGRRSWCEYLQVRVVDAGLLQGAAEPLSTQQGALVELRADECQPPPTTGQQMLRRRRARLQLRETHAVQA